MVAVKTVQKVSVIIPVKNEAKSIAAVLESLIEQSRRPDEIVITDGGSSDGTVTIIKGFISRHPFIRLICVDEALPGKGRNLAIREASHPLVAMTDAGVILDKKWLACLLRPFEEDEAIEVVYGLQDVYARSLFEKCFSIVYVCQGRRYGNKILRFPYLGAICIKKYVWEKAGGFREDLRATEDLIFFKQIEEMGFKAVVNPDAVAYWQPRASLKEAFSLAFLYSQCDFLSMFKLPKYTRKYLLKYLRKYLMYAIGVSLLFFSVKIHLLLIAVACGMLINSLLVCKKNWDQFTRIIAQRPLAYFVILSIILTLDIGSLTGFLSGFFMIRHFMDS